MSRELAFKEFDAFRKLINKYSGIWVGENKRSFLKIRLLKRMEACNITSFHEYYRYLKYNIRGREEINNLIDEVSVKETSFFRELPQLLCFQKEIVPFLIKRKKRSESLTIWSAGCSTGEEVYTLAMILEEHFPAVKAKIIGSDINRASLEIARRGIYNESSLKSVSREYKKYFTRLPKRFFEVINDVKKKVEINYINLINPAMTSAFSDIDCIFCRNVLLYLDAESRKKVLANLYSSLKPQGYLFISSSESLNVNRFLFEARFFRSCIAYEKLALKKSSQSNL